MKNQPIYKIIQNFNNNISLKKDFIINYRKDNLFQLFMEKFWDYNVPNSSIDFSEDYYLSFDKWEDENYFLDLLSTYIYIVNLYDTVEIKKEKKCFNLFIIDVLDDKIDFDYIDKRLREHKDIESFLLLIKSSLMKYLNSNIRLDIDSFIFFNLKNKIGVNFEIIEKITPYHYYNEDLDKLENIIDYDLTLLDYNLFLNDIKNYQNINMYNITNDYNPLKIKIIDKIEDWRGKFVELPYYKKVKLFHYLLLVEYLSDFWSIKSIDSSYDLFYKVKNLRDQNFKVEPISNLFLIEDNLLYLFNILLSDKYINYFISDNSHIEDINLKLKYDESINSITFYIEDNKIDKEKFLQKWLPLNSINDYEKILRKYIFVTNDIFEELFFYKMSSDNEFLIKYLNIPQEYKGISIYDLEFYQWTIIDNLDDEKFMEILKINLDKEKKFLEDGLGIDNDKILTVKRLYNIDYMILELLYVFYNIKDVELVNFPVRIKNIIIEMLNNYNIIT